MANMVRVIPCEPKGRSNLRYLLEHEWLVTNGLGGYASGTISGAATRRYHGLLIAAQPGPLGRLMMFNHLFEYLRTPDYQTIQFGGVERSGGHLELHGTDYLVEFRLEEGLPVWVYELPGYKIEKRIILPHQQNTVIIHYRMLRGEDGAVRLKLRPAIHFRSHDAPVSDATATPYKLTAVTNRYELSRGADFPPLRMFLYGQRTAFTFEGQNLSDIRFRVEESRGYEAIGNFWSPGQFRADLRKGSDVSLVASTEGWDTILALPPDEAIQSEHQRRKRLLNLANPAAKEGLGAELVLAADQFIITPAGRLEDAARAQASGDEVRTVIAGYHWFTDWGRDTMISLEGLTLMTGRRIEARFILRTFAYYIRDGLIPNLFPEGERGGLYHTADATLWFFHAVHRYVQLTGDHDTLLLILPKFIDILDHHARGTRFHIGVDPKDWLLREGAEGYQLTWMDAKVGDWVVTPRWGKAVEINALWYNALRLTEEWLRQESGDAAARPYAEQADRVYHSFNDRFWYAPGGYLYDVVDGENGQNDPACRPNQVFAISLDHPVLMREHWGPVMDVVRQKLLTPVGLRSLSPDHPDYKPQYYGDLRARDAAYHQGTVWAWLIGPFVDAWLRLHPSDKAGARRFLDAFHHHLSESGIGSISEVFDAEEPYTPRGCIAQAWSVAEVLRALVKTAE
ncbi:MAG TPA: amylo-alpha-1,6-glucosidase [Gemmataceae bacterium]|jgi:predicted glycogen debranching enzyme|nr:amylo-alpha-1,6-glucosidase [Gemmataceae bacterium]